MKILHTEASTGWGGQDIRVLVEAREMQKRGHEVIIACERGCPLWQAADGGAVRLAPVSFGRKLRWSAVREVANLITREGIEVVNTHSSGDAWSGAVAVRLRRRKGLPVCIRTRHLSNSVKPSFMHQYLYTRLTDFIITTGEAVRCRLIEENGIDGERIVSIPTGVDIELFNPARWQRDEVRAELGVGEDEFLWGMVAMIRRMKGHSVLAEAAGQLLPQRPHTRFAIVGDLPTVSPVRAAFEERLQELGIFNHFHMLGYREDVARILAGCDAVLLPSISSEGVPQSIMQAQAMGKPVVATDVGGVAEVVRNEETGLLVPPNDPGALATAMQRIMDDAALAQNLAAQGQTLIQSEYSVATMTDKVEQLYERLLGRCT